MKKCIVSVSTGMHYDRAMSRMIESLNKHANSVDHLIWRNSYPPGSLTHEVSPYAFKSYALMEAKRQGYDLVIWADANTWLIRDISPVFDYIEQNEYMFFYNGMVGNWSSDACLRVFNVSREEALQMNEIMGCCFGLDLRKPLPVEFLNQYYGCANDGVTYKGSWTNKNGEVSSHPLVYGHRHDQTVASLVLNRLGMKKWLVPHESFLYYWDDNWNNVKESIVFFKRGLV